MGEDLQNVLYLSMSKEAPFGTGYGLVPDLAASCTTWTLIQVILFQYPDLSSYKLKRFPYLDLRNRMVSFIHGILMLFMSLNFLLTAD